MCELCQSYLIYVPSDDATLNVLQENVRSAQTITGNLNHKAFAYTNQSVFTLEASDVVNSHLADHTGHFCLVLFSRSLNPSLFNSAALSGFVSKHRLGLVQLSSVSGKFTLLMTSTSSIFKELWFICQQRIMQ